MWKVYGLTGGIGSGKSTVGKILAEAGATVIDADQIAREVVAPGEPALDAIVTRFGAEYLLPDGALNREALGALVFSDPDAREALNEIIHPAIARLSGERMFAAMQAPNGPVFYEAALLVENNAYDHFAGLIVVSCSPENQIARVQGRDGLTAEEAAQRLAAQLPLLDKEAVADHVIRNDDTLESLKRSTLDLLATLRLTA